ncbi:ATP-dependent zinc protease [Pistricoccus aurantiacus]|uniref:retropepsin-like aspartic peptidase RloA3 n=1 Tax=Pistricoccus aurantiacus TaxID=1883414 RepID=UPI003630B5B8
MSAGLRRFLLVFSLLLISITNLAGADEHKVFGWVEKATIEPWGVEVKAKLDSGALTSSLDARDIESFEKNGEEWVRFRLKLEDEANNERFTETVERKVQRDLTLRGAGGKSHRPTVLMNLCIDDTLYEEEFSLRSRKKMLYPVLLGRRTISHLGLLDVEKTFLSKPSCDENMPIVPYQPEKND